jgi:hypothetical protein
VRLVSPIGGDAGGSASLSNVARLGAHPKICVVFNANLDGTIIYNNPVQKCTIRDKNMASSTVQKFRIFSLASEVHELNCLVETFSSFPPWNFSFSGPFFDN